MKSKRFIVFIKRFFLALIIIASVFTGIFLALSVFQSGYGYQFDIDELHHVNLVYLYAHGYIPYKDIYNSFYTPVFEWVIAPAFLLFGFSFTSIIFARYIMIILLIIRVTATFFFISRIFSKRTALFFLPLLFLDPFFVYSGMQIRTDNLMMTVFSVALAFLAYGLVRNSKILLCVASFLFGLSMVVFMKVIPSLAIVGGALLYYMISMRKMKLLLPLGLSFILPVVLFAAYGGITGALPEMYQQLIVEAQASYSVWHYPVPLGFYNLPNNVWVYGAMGTPITCVYAWILPLIGFAGFYQVLRDIITKREKTIGAIIKAMLCLMLIIQMIVIFKVPSVYLQHYLPLNWLFALFAAVVFDSLLNALREHSVIYPLTIVMLFLCFLYLAKASINYNIVRSGINDTGIQKGYEARWRQIPENEPIFPGYLFRPSVYPIPFGYFIGNIASIILNRLPSIPDTLEKQNIQHLLLDEYTLGTLPVDVQTYITDHYSRVPGDGELMVRE